MQQCFFFSESICNFFSEESIQHFNFVKQLFTAVYDALSLSLAPRVHALSCPLTHTLSNASLFLAQQEVSDSPTHSAVYFLIFLKIFSSVIFSSRHYQANPPHTHPRFMRTQNSV